MPLERWSYVRANYCSNPPYAPREHGPHSSFVKDLEKGGGSPRYIPGPQEFTASGPNPTESAIYQHNGNQFRIVVVRRRRLHGSPHPPGSVRAFPFPTPELGKLFEGPHADYRVRFTSATPSFYSGPEEDEGIIPASLSLEPTLNNQTSQRHWTPYLDRKVIVTVKTSSARANTLALRSVQTGWTTPPKATMPSLIPYWKKEAPQHVSSVGSVVTCRFGLKVSPPSVERP